MKWTLLVLLAGGCVAQTRDAEFNRLADRYFDALVFPYDPVQATAAGFHQYDPQLPSATRTEIQAQIDALRKFETEVAGFEARGLSASIAADREMVLSQIRGQLLSLETIRPWEKN